MQKQCSSSLCVMDDVSVLFIHFMHTVCCVLLKVCSWARSQSALQWVGQRGESIGSLGRGKTALSDRVTEEC